MIDDDRTDYYNNRAKQDALANTTIKWAGVVVLIFIALLTLV